jgi:pimeloyl-ACP methyl ester carboxylesterase
MTTTNDSPTKTPEKARAALPSLLLVPGAGHKPEHFRLLMDHMTDVDVHTVALTSSGDDPSALGDMYKDAAAVAAAAAAIDGPVVVIAHSYGGIPVTQALASAGNVRHIVYLAAFQLDVGDCLLSSVDGSPAPWLRIHHGEGLGDYSEVINPVDIFYGDVDADIAAQAVSQLGYQAFASQTQTLTEAAWKSIPSTYIICEADNAIPPVLQELFSQRSEKVQRINTCHSPFLSQPAMLAQLLRDELTSAT